ncbi:Hypothetical predicted protein [Mytilus galloprovincialis]|uniref:Uncharacterized protein n=1 Tax=Mytilus galloprovincialis TaxID=29158 RepID=A0A8B6H5G9_MYTGA|nr:Hypothetical predicted protein [Mytilus galloprovincialis]
MDLISELNTGRRRSIVDAIDDPVPRPDSSAMNKGVPKGSNIFQEALTLAYDDMRKKKKLEKSKSEQYESDEDFSDEERDVVRDIDTFRKFSMDYSAKRNAGHPRISRVEVSPRNRICSDSSVGMVNNDKKISRRHSIATIPFQESKNNNIK